MYWDSKEKWMPLKLVSDYLAALPLPGLIITFHFRVTSLSGHTALVFSPSGIAPNLSQLSGGCRFGQSGKIYWLIGLTLLTTWSSLCGKWCLHSCTNITIKVAMRQASLKAALLACIMCCQQNLLFNFIPCQEWKWLWIASVKHECKHLRRKRKRKLEPKKKFVYFCTWKWRKIKNINEMHSNKTVLLNKLHRST